MPTWARWKASPPWWQAAIAFAPKPPRTALGNAPRRHHRRQAPQRKRSERWRGTGGKKSWLARTTHGGRRRRNDEYVLADYESRGWRRAGVRTGRRSLPVLHLRG